MLDWSLGIRGVGVTRVAMVLALSFTIRGFTQADRVQFPAVLANSYININVGYVHYPFSTAALERGFTVETIDTRPPAVRVILGHQINPHLAAQISVLRPVNWARYYNVNGSARWHSVWVQHRLLVGLVRHNSAYEMVTTLDRTAQVIASVAPFANPPSENLVDPALVLRIIKRGTNYISAVEEDSLTRLPMMTMAVPTRNLHDKIDGVLLSQINLKFLWFITSQIKVGKSGYAYVIDHRNVLIAKKGHTPESFKLEDGSDHLFLQNLTSMPPDSITVYNGLAQVNVLGAISSIPSMHWKVIVELPVSEAYAPIRNMLFVMGIVLIVIFMVSFTVSVFFARQIVLPISILTQTSSHISQTKDLSKRVELVTSNEIGQLAISFNEMTEALQVSKDYVDNIVRSMADTLIVLGANGKIQSINKAGYKLLGYEENEIIGQPIGVIFVKEKEEEETIFGGSGIEKLIQRGSLTDIEKICISQNGQRIPILLSGAVMSNNQGKIQGIVCVAKDITERNRAIKEIHRLNEELENRVDKRTRELYESEEKLRQSQKMEAIGLLAGGISHDFNNLLQGITGFSTLALRKLNPDEPVYENIMEVKKAGEKAAELTRQLLAFSRKQVLKTTILNLNQVISDMRNMLRRMIREDVELVFEFEPELGLVSADSSQIYQVILNLAINAMDAMPSGGTIFIETRNIDLKQKDISKDSDCQPGGYVLLYIRDTGTGLDHETKSHIFEPFFTTKKQGKGTGLGLATVYGIVKQSGGDIEVDSELEKGTRFRIYLPQVEGKIIAKETGPAIEKGFRACETILLVEDEEIVRNFIHEVLQEAGYNVLSAQNGEEALELVQQNRKPFHLLLSDVVMPGMGGIALANQLLSQFSGLRVLLMSGYTSIGNTDLLNRISENSHCNFLQKPVSPDTLIDTVRQLLDTEKDVHN